MTLNAAERVRTSKELRANQGLCGRTLDEVQADLGFTAQQLDDTIHLRPQSHPADVWLLRDYLEQEVRAAGGLPRPYSVLTEGTRSDASRWFPLRTVPRSHANE